MLGLLSVKFTSRIPTREKQYCCRGLVIVVITNKTNLIPFVSVALRESLVFGEVLKMQEWCFAAAWSSKVFVELTA